MSQFSPKPMEKLQQSCTGHRDGVTHIVNHAGNENHSSSPLTSVSLEALAELHEGLALFLLLLLISLRITRVWFFGIGHSKRNCQEWKSKTFLSFLLKFLICFKVWFDFCPYALPNAFLNKKATNPCFTIIPTILNHRPALTVYYWSVVISANMPVYLTMECIFWANV